MKFQQMRQWDEIKPDIYIGIDTNQRGYALCAVLKSEPIKIICFDFLDLPKKTEGSFDLTPGLHHGLENFFSQIFLKLPGTYNVQINIERQFKNDRNVRLEGIITGVLTQNISFFAQDKINVVKFLQVDPRSWRKYHNIIGSNKTKGKKHYVNEKMDEIMALIDLEVEQNISDIISYTRTERHDLVDAYLIASYKT